MLLMLCFRFRMIVVKEQLSNWSWTYVAALRFWLRQSRWVYVLNSTSLASHVLWKSTQKKSPRAIFGSLPISEALGSAINVRTPSLNVDFSAWEGSITESKRFAHIRRFVDFKN